MGDASISVTGHLSLGANTFCNRGLYISALQSVEVGDDCLFGEYVSVHDENHVFANKSTPIRTQGRYAKPVNIADNVWIGAHSVILPGVHIGSGAVVGAGAVVTKDVPPEAIVAGSPARIVKYRTDAAFNPHNAN